MIPRELFRQIRRLEVRTRGLVDSFLGGEYHSAFKGRGMSFAEVRPYGIGDDVRTIDWNVSARTGETFVKVFEEEREQTLMLVVDVSGSTDFGTQGRTKRDLAAEASALLAFSAVRNNDRVGLLLFAGDVERLVPPAKGRTHALRIIRDLYVHEPRSRTTNLAPALERLGAVLHRRAIVAVLSDFVATGYERPLRSLALRHDVVALPLVDVREEVLPAVGLLTVEDAETGALRVVDTRSAAVRNAYAAAAATRRDATRALLHRLRVDSAELRTDASVLDPLARFFRERNRRRR